MRITRFIGLHLLLVLLQPAGLMAWQPVEHQDVGGGDTTPRVAIVQPATNYEVKIQSGTRPSLLVKGEAGEIPNGYRLFLGVHPTHADSIWSHEVSVSGGKWLSQAYLGGEQSTPRDGESFEIVALLTQNAPPESFDKLSGFSYYISNIVTVTVSVTSWVDRARIFIKDVPVFLPIAALFTALGAVITKWIEIRVAGKKGRPRKASGTTGKGRE